MHERTARLKLSIRPCDRRLRAELYELSVTGESEIHSLLSMNGGMTISEIAEIAGINRTEAYYMLASLQEKKLARAVGTNPIKFIAERR